MDWLFGSDFGWLLLGSLGFRLGFRLEFRLDLDSAFIYQDFGWLWLGFGFLY